MNAVETVQEMSCQRFNLPPERVACHDHGPQFVHVGLMLTRRQSRRVLKNMDREMLDVHRILAAQDGCPEAIAVDVLVKSRRRDWSWLIPG